MLTVEWYPVCEAAERACVDHAWLEQATAGGWVTSLGVRGERLVSSWALEGLVE